jgi:prepilin-type N-terminal cleavage/methylation domain-containing protein
MKIIPQKTLSRFDAFTLIELLVVIAIIAILASMIMPVINMAEQHAKKTQAKLECSNIANAIQEYESDYTRFPVSTAAQSSGAEEITCGGVFQSPGGGLYDVGSTNSFTGQVYTNNSDVIAILLDDTNFLNGYDGSGGVGGPTADMGHVKNPKRSIYLSNTHPSGYDSTQAGLPLPGIGNDLVYRDPWGNPYVITMDLDEDNYAIDAFYGLPLVSSSTQLGGGSGLVGLTWHLENGNGAYAFHGSVMVWSAGPNGQVDPNSTAITGANKNHILSWQ